MITSRGVDAISQTGQREFGDREIDLYQNTSDGVLGACLERYWSESYSNPELERGAGEITATSRYWLHVSLPTDRTIRDMQAVYNRDFNPPSKPFQPTLDSWRDLISGEETAEGIQFSLPVSDEIREVSISNYELLSSDSAVRIRDDTILLPYEELSATYLQRPVTKARITMTTTEEVYYLRLPYPDVSIESIDATTRSNDDSVQLERLAAE